MKLIDRKVLASAIQSGDNTLGFLPLEAAHGQERYARFDARNVSQRLGMRKTRGL